MCKGDSDDIESHVFIFNNNKEVVEFISHEVINQPYDEVRQYFIESNKKQCIAVEKNINDNKIAITTYFYKDDSSYRICNTRRYEEFGLLPNKYKLRVICILQYFDIIDFSKVAKKKGLTDIKLIRTYQYIQQTVK